MIYFEVKVSKKGVKTIYDTSYFSNLYIIGLMIEHPNFTISKGRTSLDFLAGLSFSPITTGTYSQAKGVQQRRKPSIMIKCSRR